MLNIILIFLWWFRSYFRLLMPLGYYYEHKLLPCTSSTSRLFPFFWSFCHEWKWASYSTWITGRASIMNVQINTAYGWLKWQEDGHICSNMELNIRKDFASHAFWVMDLCTQYLRNITLALCFGYRRPTTQDRMIKRLCDCLSKRLNSLVWEATERTEMTIKMVEELQLQR